MLRTAHVVFSWVDTLVFYSSRHFQKKTCPVCPALRFGSLKQTGNVHCFVFADVQPSSFRWFLPPCADPVHSKTLQILQKSAVVVSAHQGADPADCARPNVVNWPMETAPKAKPLPFVFLFPAFDTCSGKVYVLILRPKFNRTAHLCLHPLQNSCSKGGVVRPQCVLNASSSWTYSTH